MPVTPGRYRHVKGGLYDVIGVATHTETGEPLVCYASADDPGALWVRPYAMFTERVRRDGVETSRFTWVGTTPVSRPDAR